MLTHTSGPLPLHLKFRWEKREYTYICERREVHRRRARCCRHPKKSLLFFCSALKKTDASSSAWPQKRSPFQSPRSVSVPRCLARSGLLLQVRVFSLDVRRCELPSAASKAPNSCSPLSPLDSRKGKKKKQFLFSSFFSPCPSITAPKM